MNDIDPVLLRLAEADPAPDAVEAPAIDSWTVLLDTIRERNGKMQHTATAPWWKRGPVIATAVFALMIGAAAVFMSIRPTDPAEVAVPTTITQPVTPTEPPTTAGPPATTIAPATTTPGVAGVDSPGPGEPWDMLVIAHGRDLGEAIPQMYAERAREALGVEVRLHYDEGLYGYAGRVLEHIEGARYPDLSDSVRQAEIIVLQTRPDDTDEGSGSVIVADAESCSWSISTTDTQTPAPTSMEYWQPYRDQLDDIYAEIRTLRGNSPTVLITVDVHNPYLSEQRAAGVESECAAWQEALSSVVAEAAAANGSRSVSIYDILNGPNHDVDAAEMGYLGATEQYPTTLSFTPNEVGAALVVDALAAAGFDPQSPDEQPGLPDEVIEVTFDGNGCSTSGPSEAPAGGFAFVLTDDSASGNAELYVRRLLDGYTYQDMVGLQSEQGGPGAYFDRPDWADSVPNAFPLPDVATADNQTLQAAILEPGPHALLVWVPDTKAVWLCGSLEITEP